jgi:nucleotide-binding universal stress UspA family protein
VNGYICFYKDKRVEVHADSAYAAQCAVAKALRVSDKNRWKITVCLAERSTGETVVHTFQ